MLVSKVLILNSVNSVDARSRDDATGVSGRILKPAGAWGYLYPRLLDVWIVECGSLNIWLGRGFLCADREWSGG